MFKAQHRFLLPRINENVLHSVQEQGNPEPPKWQKVSRKVPSSENNANGLTSAR